MILDIYVVIAAAKQKEIAGQKLSQTHKQLKSMPKLNNYLLTNLFLVDSQSFE